MLPDVDPKMEAATATFLRKHVLEPLTDKWRAGCEREREASKIIYFDGGVYVIGFDICVKIEWSGDFENRWRTLQSFLPEDLVIYGIITCLNENKRRQIEKELHERFKEYRIHPTREWFRKEGELADWIAARCPLLLE
jgi:hypothetical protein